VTLTDDVDANGIGRYRETTAVPATFSGILNLALASVSAAINTLRTSLTDTLTSQPAFAVQATGTYNMARSTNNRFGVGTTTPANTAGQGWGTPTINRGFTSWSNGELTIAKAGVYAIGGYGNAPGAATTPQFLVFVNGAVVAFQDGGHAAAAVELPLQVGDKVAVGSWYATGGNLAAPANSGRFRLFCNYRGKL
jgi:hypothetical protein